LDLPIAGQAPKEIHAGPDIRSVALMGGDYVGLRPTLAVKEGDQVRPGQLLFADRDNADVRFTSPAGGVVRAIHRGERRLLQSVVIDIDAAIDGAGSEPLPAWLPAELPGLRRDQVADGLVQSGLWTALRTRPYSKIPAPGSQPHSLFVTAMDTNPLSADPALVIAAASTDFSAGLQVLTRLVEGPVHLCVAAGADIQGVEGVTRHEFAGPHPAGLVGTHIHFIDPVSVGKTVWHIGCQDVIAIGRLFLTGRLDTARVVALSGPSVVNPLLLRTRLGASIADLTQGRLRAGDIRMISGSVLSGRHAEGPLGYLGRYHNQVSALEEGAQRTFMRYLSPGADAHSALPIYVSRLKPTKTFAMNCNTNGSERAMVPLGNYEKVMPLDILPTQLLRSLIVGDTETAQKLGCLELDEEDLALCTYVCVGKYEYGPILRENLSRIEKEG